MLQEISNAFPFVGAGVRIYTLIEADRMDWPNYAVNPSSSNI